MEPAGGRRRLIGMRLASARAVASAAMLVLVAGCGTRQGGDDTTPVRPGAGDGASSDRTTELTVVVQTGPSGDRNMFSLVCDPTGGTHPDPEAACRSLHRMERPFAPVPLGVACREIYGGPQTATVTGTFRGEPVNATFSRVDGCQADRWDKHVALLVDRGGVAER